MAESATLKEMMRWPNRRHQRAQSLAHEVMRVVAPLLDELDDRRHHEAQHRGEDSPARPHKDVMRDLMNVLMATGVEFVTDHDREQCGLPARGPDGWSLEELITLEKMRLEHIMAPRPMMIVSRDVTMQPNLPGSVIFKTE